MDADELRKRAEAALGARRATTREPLLRRLLGAWEGGAKAGKIGVAHDDERRSDPPRSDSSPPAFESHKMEALGALASGIAHDFNNVLMAVQGCADMLSTALEPDHPARAHLDALAGCVSSGTSITRRLLDFCRRDASPAVVFDLNAVLVGQLEFLRRVIGDRVEIVPCLEAKEAPVKAPPSDILQAVLNLVVNARDATPSGGRITIRTRVVHLPRGGAGVAGRPALAPGAYVSVAVIDTGRGVPDELRQSLFEPFTTTKERGRGTGLGLTIVRTVVERAGGGVRVESERDVGSTFEILLPHSEEPLSPEAAPPPSPAGVGRGSETILLVEDDRLVRTATRYYLEQAGYRVLEAAGKDEAMQCCARFPGRIDLLLTDMSLPGGAVGTGVARQVRDARGPVRVVIMSAHDVGEIARELGEDGAELLQKPFASDTLLATVRRSLDARPQDATPERPAAPPRAVLFVEDDDSARWLLRGYLERIGWRVIAAGDAVEAVEAVRTRASEIAVALLDFVLPQTRGDVLARQLRELAPGLPIVYLSGLPDLEGVEPRGTVLTKPIELPRLARELERAASTGVAPADVGDRVALT